MGSNRDAASEDISALGASLRVERKRQGLSVAALSERADVSFGLISQLERGLGNPSFVSLRRLAAALGIPLAKLISGVGGRDSMVVRSGERHQLPLSPETEATLQVRRELITPVNNSVIQVIRSLVPAGFSNEGQAFRHLGMECVLVESGTLVVVHGERRVELAAGDSMTYVCSVPHWWANPGDDEAVVLGAVTPFEL